MLSQSKISINFIPIEELFPSIGSTSAFTMKKRNKCLLSPCSTWSITLPIGVALVLLCMVNRVFVGIISVPCLSPVALIYSDKGRMLQEAPVLISKVTLCRSFTVHVTRAGWLAGYFMV